MIKEDFTLWLKVTIIAEGEKCCHVTVLLNLFFYAYTVTSQNSRRLVERKKGGEIIELLS